jgi:hypothetical protein
MVELTGFGSLNNSLEHSSMPRETIVHLPVIESILPAENAPLAKVGKRRPKPAMTF